MIGPKGTNTPVPNGVSQTVTHFGSSWSGTTLPNQLFLDPGSYTIRSTASADVGALQAVLTIPNYFTWTNRDQITVVDRTKPLNIAWSGAGLSQTLTILGAATDLPTNSSTVFFCSTSAPSTSFNIPTAILGAMPASRSNVNQSKAVIYLTNMPLIIAPRSTLGRSGCCRGYFSGLLSTERR